MIDMTEAHLLNLLPRLRERDRYEVLGVVHENNMDDWAKSRARSVGVHFSLVNDGVVEVCGGIVSDSAPGSGSAWLVASDAVRDHWLMVVRVWRAILAHGGYRRLACKCYADNDLANKAARSVGFKLEGTLRGFTIRGEDVNQYGMVLGR